MAPGPLEASTFGAQEEGYATLKTSTFLVDRVGIFGLK